MIKHFKLKGSVFCLLLSVGLLKFPDPSNGEVRGIKRSFSTSESLSEESDAFKKSVKVHIKTILGRLRDFDQATPLVLDHFVESVVTGRPSKLDCFHFLCNVVPSRGAFLDEKVFNDFKGFILGYMCAGREKASFNNDFNHDKFVKFCQLHTLIYDKEKSLNFIGCLQQRLDLTPGQGEASLEKLIQLIIFGDDEPNHLLNFYLREIKEALKAKFKEPLMSEKIKVRYMLRFYNGLDAFIEQIDSDRAAKIRDASGFILMPKPNRMGQIVVTPQTIPNMDKLVELEKKFLKEIDINLEQLFCYLKQAREEALMRGSLPNYISVIKGIAGFNDAYYEEVEIFLKSLSFPLGQIARLQLKSNFQKWFSGQRGEEKIVSFLVFMEYLETVFDVNLMNFTLNLIDEITS